MKHLFLNLLVLMFVMPVNVIRSQDEYMLQTLKEQLNKSELKQIEKAEKYLVSANDLMNEAQSLETSGKNKNKAINKKIIATTDFGNAHKIIYDVYLGDIEKLLKISESQNVQKANKSIEGAYKLIKEAKKKREASLRINVPEKAYEQLEQACSLEKKAINDLSGTFLLLSGKSKKVASNEKTKTETDKSNNTKKQPTELKNENIQSSNTENNSSGNDIVKKEEILNNSENITGKQNEQSRQIIDQDNKGVFFKIQIAASKTPLSVDQLNAIYKTNEVFNVEKEGEWYKYSVSQKFLNYDEAMTYKTNLKIKGTFIIAYKDGKRVTIDEALKKDNDKGIPQNKTIEPVYKQVVKEGKIIYRLQLGISTKAMSESEIAGFKNGGKPVLTIDHGGWFSYNIGDFINEQEAQKFKKAKSLTDAIVVKFVDGVLVEQ